MYLFNSYIIVYFLYQAKTDELFHFIFQVANLQYLVSDSQKLGINIYPPEDQTDSKLPSSCCTCLSDVPTNVF